MNEKTITVALQDHVDLYGQTARRFFREVLDYSFVDCLITDESYLSDFSSCGLPDELADTASNLKELYAAWDAWVLNELRTRYGLVYTTTAVPLTTIFRNIEAFWTRRLH